MYYHHIFKLFINLRFLEHVEREGGEACGLAKISSYTYRTEKCSCQSLIATVMLPLVKPCADKSLTLSQNSELKWYPLDLIFLGNSFFPLLPISLNVCSRSFFSANVLMMLLELIE